VAGVADPSKDASSQSLREADGVKIVVEPVGGGTGNLGNFTLEIRQEFDRPAEVLPTHREKRRAVQRQVHAALPITEGHAMLWRNRSIKRGRRNGRGNQENEAAAIRRRLVPALTYGRACCTPYWAVKRPT